MSKKFFLIRQDKPEGTALSPTLSPYIKIERVESVETIQNPDGSSRTRVAMYSGCKYEISDTDAVRLIGLLNK